MQCSFHNSVPTNYIMINYDLLFNERTIDTCIETLNNDFPGSVNINTKTKTKTKTGNRDFLAIKSESK